VSEPNEINVLQALNWALDDAMSTDPSVLLFGEEVADAQGGGVIGVTKGLSTKYGLTRVRSTPISEQAIIGAAVGAAVAGMKPVAEIMLMNFVTVAMDMIVNHAAKLRFMSGGQTHVPLTIRTMTGAGFSTGGQHSDYLEAWFAHTAGIRVVTYSNPADAYGLLLASIDDEDPVMFIESMPGYWDMGPSPVRHTRVPLGKAAIVRPGKDVTIVSYGRMVKDCVAAAEVLAKDGISAEVVDLRTVAPFDAEAIFKSVAKTSRLVIAHESVRDFGVGAEISARVNEELFGQLRAPVRRVAGAFAPVPFAKPLEKAFAPDASTIEAAARSIVS
jgi:pyruvate/2-oxoglutarate/acetoin dehydrogenase E1 component